MPDEAGDLLIVYTRLPEPGRAKTRLIPALGAAGAAALQTRLTEHCLERVTDPRWTTWVAWHGGDEAAMRSWLGPDRQYVRQAAGDLGAKLQAGIALGLARGFSRVAVIGTDCPDLDRGHIAAAFAGLEDADLVIGPAADGGYYCLAVKRLHASLLAAMPWGTETVAALTRRRADEALLRTVSIEMLADVDTPADLALCDAYPSLRAAASSSCAVGR